MFERIQAETMSDDELEMLARIAALRPDWAMAGKRFGALADKCTDPQMRVQARELAEYSSQQQHQTSTGLPSKCFPKWPVGIAFLAGAALAAVALWVAGWITLKSGMD